MRSLFGPSLEEARLDVIRDRATPAGTVCPCCGQFCKVYRRKLNSGIARGLIWLHCAEQIGIAVDRYGYIHVPSSAPASIVAIAGDFAKLEHWQLAEIATSNSTRKRCSGQWRTTPLGRDFVTRSATVLSHALIYNNTLLELCGEPIDIVAALGEDFDYHELMAQWGQP